jgi:hypothetical protein
MHRNGWISYFMIPVEQIQKGSLAENGHEKHGVKKKK